MSFIDNIRRIFCMDVNNEVDDYIEYVRLEIKAIHKDEIKYIIKEQDIPNVKIDETKEDKAKKMEYNSTIEQKKNELLELDLSIYDSLINRRNNDTKKQSNIQTLEKNKSIQKNIIENIDKTIKLEESNEGDCKNNLITGKLLSVKQKAEYFDSLVIQKHK